MKILIFGWRNWVLSSSVLQTNQRQHQLPATPLSIEDAAVAPLKFVNDLGINIDADLIT